MIIEYYNFNKYNINKIISFLKIYKNNYKNKIILLSIMIL